MQKRNKIVSGVIFAVCVCAGVIVAPRTISYLRPSAVPVEPDVQTFSITFMGDMMFDRYVRTKAEERGSYVDVLDPELVSYLQSSDLSVGNLEGPITSAASVSEHTSVDDGANHFTFTFDTAVANTLALWGVDAVSLANNHAYNFGEWGVEESVGYLHAEGVKAFGYAPEPSVIVEHDGVRVALVGYNDFGFPGEDEVLRELEDVSLRSDVQIVFAHWGDEYESVANEVQRSRARRFIEAGADMVVGAHPHVVQDAEKVDDVVIYYSLGNFIFDQYFTPDVRCGLLITSQFTFEDDVLISIDTTEVYTKLYPDGKTYLEECGKVVINKRVQ